MRLKKSYCIIGTVRAILSMWIFLGGDSDIQSLPRDGVRKIFAKTQMSGHIQKHGSEVKESGKSQKLFYSRGSETGQIKNEKIKVQCQWCPQTLQKEFFLRLILQR